MKSLPKLVLTPVEVSRSLGIGITMTYQLLRQGRIPSIRIGQCGKDGKGKFIIPVALFGRWLQAEQDAALARAKQCSEESET